ncbi:MAG: Glutamyl-tRNA(Gln) amidotransferase subunit A [Candidatus Woesebacteria bacterium GW2011_GWB1_38_5b]|uniref:Glutamyl-tRNA(Gln) amidotransferase subunit A n=1 Tax=Candidatus Woesebacteria bacterium GW2011_GWB1_38_5b TaxID=1618569 RepID=A0A0G0KAQ7_9BACT|nr:MAG: Glutamyl-tRNA(Gln) amidotransferase subunit A [Candidatus Woesebacteria bacterium GW2011_GWB1_38_5b]
MDLPISIKNLHEDLKSKKYSLSELTDTYLRRIDTYDKNLNSFLTVTSDLAYGQAKKYDQILKDLGDKAFEQYPLLGVPIAFKDIYLTKGIRTTAASNVLKDYIPVYSSTVVERLLSSGCIMIGKTNCDAWAHGASGENSDFGSTKNPWNQEYVPGGSSSGSAVSVSSGFSLVAMGTDTGGSIRQPASFCNLVGLKPTYGSVSRYGVISMASSLDSMGSFGHTPDDVKKLFDVTCNPDGKDSTVTNLGSSNLKHKVKRIGIPKEYFVEGLDSEVKSKVMEAAEVYKKLGYEIVEISLPHTKYAIAVYYIVQPAEVSSNLARFDGIRYANERSAFGNEAKRRIMLGTYVLSSGYYDAYYLKAMKVRSKLIEDFNNAWHKAKVDVILTPTSPTPPFKLGERSSDPMQMYLADVYTVAINLAGIPGLAMPCGFTETGLPVGFQLFGPRFDEGTLFELGTQYQQNTNFHLQKPKL